MVLVLAFGLALVTGVVFGDVPAWFATRTDPMGALRQSGRSACDGSWFIRTGLLAVQATWSIVFVAEPAPTPCVWRTS
jgi:hypothetical protein